MEQIDLLRFCFPLVLLAMGGIFKSPIARAVLILAAFTIFLALFIAKEPQWLISNWAGFGFDYIFLGLFAGTFAAIISAWLKWKPFTGFLLITLTFFAMQVGANIVQVDIYTPFGFMLQTFFGWAWQTIPFGLAGLLFVRNFFQKEWWGCFYSICWLVSTSLVFYSAFVMEQDRLYTIDPAVYKTYLNFISQPVALRLYFGIGTVFLLALPYLAKFFGVN